MKKLMFGMVVAMAANAFAISGSISTELETVSGEIKWQPRAKAYLIEKGRISREIKIDDVTGIDIPKPANFDKAVQMVDAGQGASAVGILAKIVTDYRMLQWDKPAARYLALAHLAAGNAQKAYEVCQPVISEDKSAAYTGDMAAAYWQAMMKLGKFDQLEGLLKKAASSGDRSASAAALVMRGDIIMNSASDDNSKVRQAMTDGYLRVWLMYQEPECRRERVEAGMKAAAAFDRLGQTARAERLRAQVKQI